MCVNNKQSLYISYSHLQEALPTIALWVGMEPELILPELNKIAYRVAVSRYQSYQSMFPDEPFDKFYSWGAMLIADFDELDRYLVDAQAIFRNLFELKEIDTTIESWLNEDGKPSDFQARYLQFWELMGDFYEKLRKLRTA